MDRREYLSMAVVTSCLSVVGCTGTGETEAESTTETENPDLDRPTLDPDETRDETDEDEDEDETEEPDDVHPLVGTYDDFESLDHWIEYLGTMGPDRDRSSLGSQSVLMRPNDERTARLRWELDEPIDVRGVTPGIAVTADGPGWTMIQLQDADNNYNEFGQFVPGGTPFVRKNFGLTRVRGDPDPSRVTVIQFVRWYVGDSSRFWVDDLHFVPRPDHSAVALIFRGGHESHHQHALSLLESNGLDATALVPTERIGAGGAMMTADQVGDLDRSGWTVGSYGATGRALVGLGDGQLDREIDQSAAWLDERGFAGGPSVVGFPDGRYDAASYERVTSAYDLGFAARSRSQGYAGNPHLWTVAESPSNAEDAIELVDWAADIGGITAIPFDALPGDSLAALEATIARVTERVTAGDLEVITPADMVDQYVSPT
ncbi:polysaccharide deacetylase family protein [Halovivax gelatinilyticus]|uniref:polysaccharide deacetylase family protein n=1 Tax=Halovivax gelatinilyticus TaxID=2961597 RepID=UPI0020CA9C62|nr:polysaccharide deacetylase family protein [Halovivax gelatinilyticus]